MDEEEDKKDDVALADGVLDDMLDETEDDAEGTEDPLGAGMDEFGGGGNDEKQWE